MRQRALHYSSTRLAVTYVGLCALCVGAVLWVGFLITARGLTREVDRVIAAELDGLKDEYDQGGLARLVATLNRRTDSWGRGGAAYLLVDAHNHKIAGNLSGWPLQPRFSQGWVEFDITAPERGDNIDRPVRAEIFALGDYRLLVGTDVSERRTIAARLRDTTLWGIGFAALLSALVGWWYSRRVAGRVREVAQTCEKIISDDLTQRLPQSDSRNEFDQLAAAVNRMLDRIEQQTSTVRATFNSAAHDLRSPLHRMRVRLESAVSCVPLEHAARSAVEDTIADLERVQRTLATLLQIAQANAVNTLRGGEAVDLAELGHELGELYDPEARQRGLELTVRARGPASVSGNRQLLAQLVANLLENAIKYVPSGGHIGLTVEATPTLASLIVSDNGPGIAMTSIAAAPRGANAPAWQRWTSGAADPPGSGLGLSLVAAVVRMHRGRLAIWDNEPGLIVRCDFPPVTAARS
ncbi:MAG TPA: HAMP domain-containing sensor histidine kinase [Steroidobacteraceae bacterium]|jgi:signal transduction histidine kinase|nr:HAMP domain-containing sensor histidine kinase [Steroidobacteraceae bacterium]